MEKSAVKPTVFLEQPNVMRSVAGIVRGISDEFVRPGRKIAVFLLFQGGVSERVQVSQRVGGSQAELSRQL